MTRPCRRDLYVLDGASFSVLLMLTDSINLQTLAARLTHRQPEHSEPNMQSDLHLLLTMAPLDLGDEDLQGSCWNPQPDSSARSTSRPASPCSRSNGTCE
jgi:hypothetical protein